MPAESRALHSHDRLFLSLQTLPTEQYQLKVTTVGKPKGQTDAHRVTPTPNGRLAFRHRHCFPGRKNRATPDTSLFDVSEATDVHTSDAASKRRSTRFTESTRAMPSTRLLEHATSQVETRLKTVRTIKFNNRREQQPTAHGPIKTTANKRSQTLGPI